MSSNIPNLTSILLQIQINHKVLFYSNQIPVDTTLLWYNWNKALSGKIRSILDHRQHYISNTFQTLWLHRKHIVSVCKKLNQIILQDPQHQQYFNCGKMLPEGVVDIMALVTWVPTINMAWYPSLNLPY